LERGHCTAHYSLALGKAASGFAAAASVAELSIVSASRAIYASYLQMERRPRFAAPCLREPQLNRNYFYEQNDRNDNCCARPGTRR
jgi:hypothetical protein